MKYRNNRTYAERSSFYTVMVCFNIEFVRLFSFAEQTSSNVPDYKSRRCFSARTKAYSILKQLNLGRTNPAKHIHHHLVSTLWLIELIIFVFQKVNTNQDLGIITYYYYSLTSPLELRTMYGRVSVRCLRNRQLIDIVSRSY